MFGPGDGAAPSAGGTKEKKNENKSGVASRGAAVQADVSVAGRRRFGSNQSGIAFAALLFKKMNQCM